MFAICGIIYARKGSTWTHHQVPVNQWTRVEPLAPRIYSSCQFFGISCRCVLQSSVAAWAFAHLLTTALSKGRRSLAATPAAKEPRPASKAGGRRAKCHPLSYPAAIPAAKARNIAKTTCSKGHARSRPSSRIAQPSAAPELKPAPTTNRGRARRRNPNSLG